MGYTKRDSMEDGLLLMGYRSVLLGRSKALCTIESLYCEILSLWSPNLQPLCTSPQMTQDSPQNLINTALKASPVKIHPKTSMIKTQHHTNFKIRHQNELC